MVLFSPNTYKYSDAPDVIARFDGLLPMESPSGLMPLSSFLIFKTRKDEYLPPKLFSPTVHQNHQGKVAFCTSQPRKPCQGVAFTRCSFRCSAGRKDLLLLSRSRFLLKTALCSQSYSALLPAFQADFSLQSPGVERDIFKGPQSFQSPPTVPSWCQLLAAHFLSQDRQRKCLWWLQNVLGEAV